MRLLSQTIAQRANRDDEEVGKFWQARYKAVRLLDETAILACSAYVDLNPIQAAVAETLEASDYTSVQGRVQSLTADATRAARFGASNSSAPACGQAEVSQSQSPTHLPPRPDRMLAPLSIDELRDALGPCPSNSPSRQQQRLLGDDRSCLH